MNEQAGTGSYALTTVCLCTYSWHIPHADPTKLCLEFGTRLCGMCSAASALISLNAKTH